MKDRQSYIYIMSNKGNTVFYTGVTNDLEQRVCQHKEKIAAGFTKKYNIDKLVYYETFDDINSAIEREKQVKGGSRKKKVELIKSINPMFRDLYEEL